MLNRRRGRVLRPQQSSFLFQLRGPIGDQGDRRAGLADFVGNSESSAVGGDVESTEHAVGTRSKERVSAANFKTGGAGLYFRGHHFVVRGEIENFLAVAAPARAGERHDVDFVITGFV